MGNWDGVECLLLAGLEEGPNFGLRGLDLLRRHGLMRLDLRLKVLQLLRNEGLDLRGLIVGEGELVVEMIHDVVGHSRCW